MGCGWEFRHRSSGWNGPAPDAAQAGSLGRRVFARRDGAHFAPPLYLSTYADVLKTAQGTSDIDPVSELAAVAEAKTQLSRREEATVRRARHAGLSWAEIGTLLGVTRQTMHRKYRKVG